MRFVRSRYVLVLLLCFGMVILFAQRRMVFATMNNMVYHTYVKLYNGTSKGFCYKRLDNERNVTSVFGWTIEQQWWVLEAHSWGYVFGNFPGAYLAEFVSAKWTWFGSVATSVACTLIFPNLSMHMWWQHLVTRIIQGFATSMVFPATSLLLAEWAPEGEKNTLGSIAFTGCTLGLMVGRVCSTALMETISWKNMYYIMGGLGGLWLILWIFFAFDKPIQSTHISEEERRYILKSNIDIINKTTITHIKWRHIFTSKPFWALLVMHSSCNTVFELIVKHIPIYMWDVLMLQMRDIVIYTNLAYTVQCIFSLLLGKFLDKMVNRKKITQSWAKKISTLVVSAPSFVCLMFLSYVKCHLYIATGLIMITCVCFGGKNTGYLINHVDIGPKIAGRLMATTNTMAAIGAIFSPLMVGTIIDEANRSIITWRIVFWICGGFFIVDMMCYTVWGRAENQNYYWEETKIADIGRSGRAKEADEELSNKAP